MKAPVGPSQRRIRIARVILCLLGVVFLAVGTVAGVGAYEATGSVPGAYLIWVGGCLAMGLYQLYLGIFGAGNKAVEFLASLMDEG